LHRAGGAQLGQLIQELDQVQQTSTAPPSGSIVLSPMAPSIGQLRSGSGGMPRLTAWRGQLKPLGAGIR
jgi:hypothetical protein